MKQIQFKEVKHRFPKESLLCWLNEKNDGEFDEEWVIYIDHDLELENLDLDRPLTSLETIHNSSGMHQENYLAILIEGNLKAKNIYNEESDGSTCLCVLGNLETDHIIIGGQELYITGDLNVKQCFWGNYNHGDLVVNGIIKSRVFVATEQYHYEKEKLAVEIFLCDEEEDDFQRKFPAAIFSEDILYEEDEVDIEDVFTWNDWISRSTAIKMLEQNRSVLL